VQVIRAIHTASEQAYSLLDNVPDELKTYPQWLVWKLVDAGEKKPRKLPYSACTGKLASVSDPATWCVYHRAVEVFEAGDYSGTGFMFTIDDPFVGIDLDHCRNPQTGQLEAWAGEIVERLSSYTEASPSGTGVHIICRGTVLAGRCQQGTLEIYNSGRFFTITGEHLGGTPPTIEERSAQLTHICAQYFQQRKKTHAKWTAKEQSHVAAELARVREALQCISAEPYDPWIKMGMATHALDSGEAGFAVWLEWSRTCPEKFDEVVCRKKWVSFTADRENGITIATLFDLAIKSGWRNGNGNAPPEPPEPDFSELADEEENARMAAQEREPEEPINLARPPALVWQGVFNTVAEKLNLWTWEVWIGVYAALCARAHPTCIIFTTLIIFMA
jgi:Primase C terminal 2 (PriCT-2)